MCQSILLLSRSKTFAAYFGQEMFALEDALSNTNTKMPTSIQQRTWRIAQPEYTQCVYNDKDELVPVHPEKYALTRQIAMTGHVSDDTHWGRLAWQFCEFVDAFGDPKAWTMTRKRNSGVR
jgi:hypothetical protein